MKVLIRYLHTFFLYHAFEIQYVLTLSTSQFRLTTFQVFSHHVWLMAAILDSWRVTFYIV